MKRATLKFAASPSVPRHLLYRSALYIAFYCGVLFGINGQQLDSLESILENTNDPQVEVNVLLEIGKIQRTRNVEESLKAFRQASVKAEAIGYQYGRVEGLLSLGAFFARSGQTDSAFNYYSSAKELVGESLDVLYGFGLTFHIQGNYDQAKVYFGRLLEESQALNDLNVQAKALLMLGSVSALQGKLSSAIQYQLDALALSELSENMSYQVMLHNNLSSDYSNLADYERALYHARASLKLTDETDLWSTSTIYTNMGLYEGYLGNNNEALRNHQKSYNLLQELGDTCRLVIPLNNMVDILRTIEPDSSIQINKKILKISSNCDNDQYQINALLGLGVIYFQKGNSRLSQRYLEEGYELAKSIAYLERQNIIAEQLYKLYDQQLKDQEKAFFYLEIHDQLSESLSDAANDREIARLESKFEFNKQKQLLEAENERDLLLRDQELQSQRWYVIIGLIFIFGLIVIGLLMARFRIRSKAQETEKLKEIGQFKEAMTGMIAHDLKNPLSVLNLKTVSDPTSQAMTRQMLDLVTNMLDVQKLESAAMPIDKTSLQVASLADEARKQVHPLLREKNLDLIIEVNQQDVVSADHDLLLRVLVNLLTNAIKYSPLNASIRVTSRSEENKVHIAVEDQGSGIPEVQQVAIFDPFGQVDPLNSGGVASTGLGLTFCKLVLQAHGTQIKVESQEGQGAKFFFALEAVAADTVEAISKDANLVMTEKDRMAIIAAIPRLKQFELHQAVEIEEALEPLTNIESEAVCLWVESVLNAAYAGNEENFEELLAEVDR